MEIGEVVQEVEEAIPRPPPPHPLTPPPPPAVGESPLPRPKIPPWKKKKQPRTSQELEMISSFKSWLQVKLRHVDSEEQHGAPGHSQTGRWADAEVGVIVVVGVQTPPRRWCAREPRPRHG